MTLTIMAMAFPKLLFFLFLLLPLLSSGTQVGFSYHARGNAATSLASKTVSFLKLNQVSPSQIRVFAAEKRVLSSLSNTGVSVDLYLSQTQVLSLINSSSSETSWLKTQVGDVKVGSIIISTTLQRQDHDLPMLLSVLRSIHSGLSKLHADHDVKVSAAFSLSFIKHLGVTRARDLHRICSFIKKAGSWIVMEDNIEEELNMGDDFAQKMIQRAKLALSLLSSTDVSILVKFTSPAVPNPTQVAELSNKVSKHLQNNTEIRDRVLGLYAQVSHPVDQKLERQKEQTFPSSHRQLHTTSHDEINPPNTIFPTTPISTTPITIPPDTPFVTVPATNPVTITPTNPASTPVPLPSTTTPTTDPANSPIPITNPVTTPPVTNPVTTYPAPAAGIPVTNPVAPPATTNAPAGQSWCVAKAGAPESSVQAALDYACGIGGADCAQIQQSGSCYNPITLQNHASYAFNSYYQKNPSPSSCDFGGTATITNTNPSTGSCIFPSSSSPSSKPPPTSSMPPPVTSSIPPPQITAPTPVTTPITTPTPTTSSSSGAGVSGSGTPPMVPNTGDPASGTPTVFGSEIPPSVNTSTTSISARLQPFLGCIFLVTSFATQKIIQ